MTPIKPMVVREKSYWPHIAAIAALWGAAMTMQWHDEQQLKEQIDADFADCLRGKWKHVTPEGDELMCYPVAVLKKGEKRQ